MKALTIEPSARATTSSGESTSVSGTAPTKKERSTSTGVRTSAICSELLRITLIA